MLVYSGHGQPCATCGFIVRRVRVGVEVERRGYTLNQNIPCGCVHNVRPRNVNDKIDRKIDREPTTSVETTSVGTTVGASQ